jgi:hypothetical protein
MGRGRSKAKQTKVARDLKYSSQDIDIDRLSKELNGEVEKGDDDDFDPYAEGNYIPRK